MIGNLNVTNISIEGEMDILMYDAINCYNQSGMPLDMINTKPSLTVVPSFTVSITKTSSWPLAVTLTHTLMVFSTVNCFSIGCLSKCTNNTHNIVNGTCSGIGCCQIDIPEGLRNIKFAAYCFDCHKEVWSFNPCSFTFIIQRDKFNFTCEVALNKGTYICGANSNCSNHTNGFGYRCKCKEGYEGNPYLKDGCQGIFFNLLIYL